MHTVALQVDGLNYHGWKSVQITRSMQTIAGHFQLDYTDRWQGQNKPSPLFPGQNCVVLIGKQPVITGYIDAVNTSFDKNTRTASFTGRDKTADLVDCSAIHKPGEFHNLDLSGIAKALVASFKIDIQVNTDVGKPFSIFKLQPSESVFEALERAARLRGVLLLSDRLGHLLLTSPSKRKAHVNLVQGKNVLNAQRAFDFKERYSRYIVKGQQQGFEELTPELTTQVNAESTDANIKRYRPLVVLSEAQVDEKNAQIRANWEATVRAARSNVITLTVQGWLQNEQTLWDINQRVSVTLPWLGIRTDLLISQVTFSLNENQGSTTTLQLMPPDAFIPEPKIAEQNNWKTLIDANQ